MSCDSTFRLWQPLGGVMVPSSPGMIPVTADSILISKSNVAYETQIDMPSYLMPFPIISTLGTSLPLGAS